MLRRALMTGGRTFNARTIRGVVRKVYQDGILLYLRYC